MKATVSDNNSLSGAEQGLDARTSLASGLRLDVSSLAGASPQSDKQVINPTGHLVNRGLLPKFELQSDDFDYIGNVNLAADRPGRSVDERNRPLKDVQQPVREQKLQKDPLIGQEFFGGKIVACRVNRCDAHLDLKEPVRIRLLNGFGELRINDSLDMNVQEIGNQIMVRDIRGVEVGTGFGDYRIERMDVFRLPDGRAVCRVQLPDGILRRFGETKEFSVSPRVYEALKTLAAKTHRR